MRKIDKFNALRTIIIGLLVLAIASPAFGSSETVRIFVEYKGNQSEQVRQALNAAGSEFHYQFQRLNSFVVTVPEDELENLRFNPNVVAIEMDVDRYLVEPTALYQDLPDLNNKGQIIPWGIQAVQALDVWDANRDGKVDKKAPTGEGVTVCIIDTGYYSEHEDLADVNLVGSVSQVDDNALEDGYGHGTHVAGTVSAVNNNLGVVGVTPGTVNFFIVKIFDNTGAWVSKAHASDLIAGIYQCQDGGADIISMSLSGTSQSGKERMAFDDLYNQGILHVAAASNEGIEEYHYPASYDSVISVAAINSDLGYADFSQFNDQVELAAPGVSVLSTLPFVETSEVNVGGNTWSGYSVEYAARGTATGLLADGGLCTTTSDWAGMVVMCYRGENSFYEKVMNVQNSGGVAAVIYNNLDEDLYATLGEGNTSAIPAIGLSQAQGFELLSRVGQEATVTNLFEWPASGYQHWGGTSMATPHVSGVAALLMSACPDASNVEIREAMDMTALDLGDLGRDVHYGFGLVQAYDALDYLNCSKPGGGPKGPQK
jgi:subtilisin family serine protease